MIEDDLGIPGITFGGVQLDTSVVEGELTALDWLSVLGVGPSAKSLKASNIPGEENLQDFFAFDLRWFLNGFAPRAKISIR